MGRDGWDSNEGNDAWQDFLDGLASTAAAQCDLGRRVVIMKTATA
jgi:hypothetical protein